jgi:hypothetical protein
MKKSILLLFSLFTFGIAFSQNTFPTGANTNVGIGTGATAPTTRLQLTSATAGTSGFRITNLTSTTATTAGLLGKAMSVDANGNVVLVPVVNTNLFTADGALASARTVNMSTFNLTFNPSTASSQFFINGTTGNVGVGTITPATKLEVKSTTAGTSGVRLTNLLSTSPTVASNGKALSVDATGNVILVPVTGGVASGIDSNTSLTAARTVTMANNNFIFKPTNNADFLINGANGKVGIGVPNPLGLLHIGDATGSGVVLNNRISSVVSQIPAQLAWGESTIGTAGDLIVSPRTDISSSVRFFTNNGTNINERFRILGNGNVGIGTDAPSAKLEVKSGVTDNSGLKLTNLTSASAPVTANGKALSVDATGNVILVPAGGGTSSNIYTADGTLTNTTAGLRTVNLGSNNLSFNPTNSSSFNINGATGNVGIGVVNPTGVLDVKGGLSDGQTTFTSLADSYLKSLVLNIGSIRNTQNSTRMLTFFDIPSSNINPKSQFLFKIEDRADKTRFYFTAETGGATDFQMLTRDQQYAFRVVEEGNDKVTMTMPKPNSKFAIGTETSPVGVIDVKGGLSDGQVFTDVYDSYLKSCLLNIGTVRDALRGTRLLTFFDIPSSNINPKSQVVFNIEDRADKKRLKISAMVGGYSDLELNNSNQQPFFRASNNGLDFSYLEMPTSDSHFVIGGPQTWPIAHKLWVKAGSSKFEGDVFADANLGIGTDKFTDGTEIYRLSVNGSVRATKVKVYTTWADYVFNKEYNLRSLQELEDFIEQNGHLPNVPSAQEVAQKGLDLGDMSRIQQEKIEELTLYLIQQNKEIQELKAQMKALLEKK